MEVPLCHKIILANLYNNPEKPKDLHRKISVTGSVSVIKPYPNEKQEKEVITLEEFNKMIEFEKNPIIYAFFYTAYWTG